MTVAIYSSGSVLAQRLLFSTTADGDLVPFISAFFDTMMGAKTSADSYREIATALRWPTSQILFVSDSPAELSAARAAGCQTLLCLRPGNRGDTAGDASTIRSFDDIV
jgi:enolase-phosphatase E1